MKHFTTIVAKHKDYSQNLNFHPHHLFFFLLINCDVSDVERDKIKGKSLKVIQLQVVHVNTPGVNWWLNMHVNSKFKVHLSDSLSRRWRTLSFSSQQRQRSAGGRVFLGGRGRAVRALRNMETEVLLDTSLQVHHRGRRTRVSPHSNPFSCIYNHQLLQCTQQATDPWFSPLKANIPSGILGVSLVTIHSPGCNNDWP